MVKKRQTKRQRDIKTKLMAAICMLLVSSIMMVSTTYAWFTLSTAPEVTGIQTAVGANGNLEMALQPYNGASESIVSSVGDSAQVASVRNTTWGNLVDLNDNLTYGLNQVMLYPSQLVTEETANGTAIKSTSPLATPTYGADGRVYNLAENTMTGVFNNAGKFENSIDYNGTNIPNAKGVRAVGVSSGMTDRQLAFRQALAAANSAATKAKSIAGTALNANGAKLADLAIKHATGSGTETYDNTELVPLQAIVNALLGSDDTAVDGALEYIESALVNYALAAALNNDSDDEYAATVTAFQGANRTNLASLVSTHVPGGMATVTDVIDELNTAIANVTSAKATIDPLAGSTRTDIAWTDFSEALNKLANTEKMKINGIPVGKIKADWVLEEGESLTTEDTENGYHLDTDGKTVLDEENKPVSNMTRLVNSAFGGLKVTLASGAGVFADIADFCGNYSASVKLAKVEYNGLKVSNLNADMATASTVTTPYLDAAATAVGTFQAGNDATASQAINDFYGYIIDLAFRTNVAGSSLLLQTEAVDRIYSDSTNEQTMGGGANMTFTSVDVNQFSNTQVKELMGGIRVVFFTTDNHVIKGYARLDISKATTDTDTNAITAPLVMYDEENGAFKTDAAIMGLDQNVVHELSVLVYLDGAAIGNDDVANGAYSMTGTMNLQFSSSATLVPMDYTALKEGQTAAPSLKETNLTKYTVTTGYTVAGMKHISDGTNNKVVAVITKDGAPLTADSDVTITIDGKTATYTTISGVSGWVADADATAPTGEVAVVVTATAADGT